MPSLTTINTAERLADLVEELDLTDEDLAAPFIPSADEIAMGCALAQRSWSERERKSRLAQSVPATEVARSGRGQRRGRIPIEAD